MKRLFISMSCAALALSMTAVPVMAESPALPEMPSQTMAINAEDTAFLRKAAEMNLIGIELGKAAAELGEAEEIKTVGRKLVEDHEKANRDLQQLAAGKGVILPTALPDARSKELDELKAKRGKAFDDAFLAANTKAHEDAISLFEAQASSTGDAAIRTWTVTMVGHLRDHLNTSKGAEPAAVGEQLNHKETKPE